MKKLLAGAAVFILSGALLCPQTAPETTAPEQKAEVPQLLVHTGKTFDFLSFRLLDGPALEAMAPLDLAAKVPLNQDLVKQTKGLMTTYRVLNVVGWVSVLGMIASPLCKGYEADVFLGCFLTWGTNLCAEILVGNATSARYLRAVDNYNLYIMGIPIQH